MEISYSYQHATIVKSFRVLYKTFLIEPKNNMFILPFWNGFTLVWVDKNREVFYSKFFKCRYVLMPAYSKKFFEYDLIEIQYTQYDEVVFSEIGILIYKNGWKILTENNVYNFIENQFSGGMLVNYKKLGCMFLTPEVLRRKLNK